jgi:Elongation factor P (EF-P) OB domain
MRPDTYEQVEVPSAILGPGERFLQPGMQLPVEFFDNEPIGVVFPEIAEVRVAETVPATGWRLERGNLGERSDYSRSFVHRPR